MSRYRTDKEFIDSIIGKDIWVKVQETYYSIPKFLWMRFVNSGTDDGDLVYYVNYVRCRHTLSEHRMNHVEIYCYDEYDMQNTEFVLVHPIDTATTEELIQDGKYL